MQLKELLIQIDSQRVEIHKLRPLKPDVERRIMQKFRLDWNYHSNAIEGNSLTLGETRAFLLEGLTANGKPMKDHLDIKGHDDLITFLEFFVQRKERLTEAAIREMHNILLKEPYETDAVTSDGRIVKKKVHLGEYKSDPNCVRMGSGEIHQYVLPQDVGPKMAELVAWNEKEETNAETHPLIRAAMFHYRFVAIHPFDDGNGRMARILMNLILMRAGFPPAIIKLQTRDQYVAVLRKADAGESEGIVSFIGENLLEAENLYLRGAHGEQIEDADDVDREVALLKRELQSAPTPASLTLEVQRTHVGKQLGPFLNRLHAKLVQFDDLFAKATCNCSIVFRIAGSGGVSTHGFQGPRSELLGYLNQFNAAGNIIIEARFVFNWEGFLRDGPNDFSLSLDYNAHYEERKMRFTSNATKLNRTLMYQTWFSEDEIQSLLSNFTKSVLQIIQQSRSKTGQ